jgi:hypothetical protein
VASNAPSSIWRSCLLSKKWVPLHVLPTQSTSNTAAAQEPYSLQHDQCRSRRVEHLVLNPNSTSLRPTCDSWTHSSPGDTEGRGACLPARTSNGAHGPLLHHLSCHSNVLCRASLRAGSRQQLQVHQCPIAPLYHGRQDPRKNVRCRISTVVLCYTTSPSCSRARNGECVSNELLLEVQS